MATTETAASRAPVVRLIERYLEGALRAGASDLQFEPSTDSALRVRMRVDGILEDLDTPPMALVAPLITRLRLAAGVDLAERRLPQDGRLRLPDWRPKVDIRAAFLPVCGGERVALRLLGAKGAQDESVGGGNRTTEGSFADLGMEAADRASLERSISKPNGLVLVVGPTGSGKTTTLYAMVERLRRPDRSLVTVEDPVERLLAGTAQVEVDENVGRSFAVVLRALLRQDPDVVMVGEMRDTDSARIACRAALTGHLVLSSLHTADCRQALVRMKEMGVADYLMVNTVTLVIAQRLLRRLCPHCLKTRRPERPELELYARAGLEAPDRLALARGCAQCSKRGFSGRRAVFELLDLDHVAPRRARCKSLLASALALAAALETTVGEALARCPMVEPKRHR